MLNSKETASGVLDFLNFSTDKDLHTFIRTLSDGHPTIQQRFTKLCYLWLMHLAQKYEKGDYDGRNRHSAEFGALVRNILIEKAGGDDHSFPVI